VTCDTPHVIVKGSRSRLPTPTPSPHDTLEEAKSPVAFLVISFSNHSTTLLQICFSTITSF
jgi:hypothetical protein